MSKNITRREFVETGAGLVIAFHLPPRVAPSSTPTAAGAGFAPNAWLRVGTDGIVTLTVDKSEMGQGPHTALAMILADELEADWSRSSSGPCPRTPPRGRARCPRGARAACARRGTRCARPVRRRARCWWPRRPRRGGSSPPRAAPRTVRSSTRPAGAGSATPFSPARRPRSTSPRTRRSRTRRTFGSSAPGYDGSIRRRRSTAAPYSASTCGFPACLSRASSGAPSSAAGSSASTRSGRTRCRASATWCRSTRARGPARTGRGAWAAPRASRSLPTATGRPLRAGARSRSSGTRATTGRSIPTRSGLSSRASPSSPAPRRARTAMPRSRWPGPRSGSRRCTRSCSCTATMEPMNCTAHVRADGCDVWAPTQNQTRAQEVAAELTGLPKERVRVHTTFLGGGFGRRLEPDFVSEAVRLSKAVGAPVKVIWSREDDVRHGFYRPATYNRFVAGLDATGSPVAWTHRIVAPPILLKFGPLEKGIDRTLIDGAANLPYGIPNVLVDQVAVDLLPVPRGFWRSVGISQNAFVTECFCDEVAVAAGKDPYEFRRALLGDKPRHRRTLELAAEKAGWGSPLPAGQGRGIALAEWAPTTCAQVAEVSVAPDGRVRVHRVVCAVDCGPVGNPDTIEAQLQGGIVYGLTAALYGEITIERGRVKQGNFDDYPLLRLPEMPVVEVYIVPSSDAQGGIGEPAVGPIAPAVCNAIFAATGKRVRRLPIGKVA